MGYVVVPLYDTLGENAVEYILNHSEAVYLAVSAAKLPQIAAALPNVSQAFLGVTVWGAAADAAAVKTIFKNGIDVTPFEELASSGQAALVPEDAPAADSLSTVMYTSGTTGQPKGVMLSHASIVATVHSLWRYLEAHNIPMGPGVLPAPCSALPNQPPTASRHMHAGLYTRACICAWASRASMRKRTAGNNAERPASSSEPGRTFPYIHTPAGVQMDVPTQHHTPPPVPPSLPGLRRTNGTCISPHTDSLLRVDAVRNPEPLHTTPGPQHAARCRRAHAVVPPAGARL